MPPEKEKKTALVAAVEILAKRLVSTHELRSKLAAKKLYSPGEIEDALQNVPAEYRGLVRDYFSELSKEAKK